MLYLVINQGLFIMIFCLPQRWIFNNHVNCVFFDNHYFLFLYLCDEVALKQNDCVKHRKANKVAENMTKPDNMGYHIDIT